jgi:hypothetical protein
MEKTVTNSEDRVEVRDDGSKIVTPAFAKDAPAPTEKRETNPFVDGPKHQQDEMQKILSRLQKTAEEHKQRAQEKKVEETASKDLPKFDAVISQSIEEKKETYQGKTST